MAAVVIAPTTHHADGPANPRAGSGGRRPAFPTVRGRPDRWVYWRRRALIAAAAAVLAVAAVPAVRALGRVGWWSVVTSGGAPAVTTTATAPALPARAPGGPAPVVYVVEPGDTLWSIARRIDPHGDPRPIVERLVERSGGAALRPGQRVSLEGLP